MSSWGGASTLLIGQPRTPRTELPEPARPEAYLRTTPTSPTGPDTTLPAPPQAGRSVGAARQRHRAGRGNPLTTKTGRQPGDHLPGAGHEPKEHNLP